MRKTHLTSFFCLVLLGFACSSTRSLQTQSPVIQSKLEALLAAHELPGMNVSLVYADGKAEDYALGFADVEAQTPNNPAYKLLSGSIGKTYAAALLFQLVDAGEISLEDKFIDYFPDLDWLKRLPNIEQLSLEMLLEHTSGLPRWVMKDVVWEDLRAAPDKVWSYEDRFSYIFDAEPVHEAGKGWGYSDTNYLLLGMLIEKVTGQGYYEALEERILDPFKLKNTLPSNQREIPGLIAGYSKLPAQFKIPAKTLDQGKYPFNPQMEWTGGGIASTAHDLAAWCKMYFEGKVFSQALVQQMTQPNPNGVKAMGPHDYGRASFIYHTPQGTAYGHSGFMPGFNALMAYFPEQKLAVAIQLNCDYAGQNKFNMVGVAAELAALAEIK